MKRYYVFSLQKNYLVFSKTEEFPSPEEFINTFKNYHDKFIFTHYYFKNNIKHISKKISDEVHAKKITSAYIEDETILLQFLEVLKEININSLYIKNFISLKIDECNLIINNRYLKYINCYYIPYLYLKRMQELNKDIHMNYMEVLSNKFMLDQDVIDSESIYYKKVLHYKVGDAYKTKDLGNFLNLNQYLKTIHLHAYTKEMLNNIVEVIKKHNKEHIVILLYQNNNNDFISNNFEFLKKLNKTYKTDTYGEIRIIYSSNFVKNNLFRQLTYNNIKMSIVIILYVVLIGLVFTELYNYVTKLNIQKLNYELYENIPESSSSELLENSSNYSSSSEETDIYDFEKSFIKLKSINPDTVGWLTVNNTRVDYPVVKSSNNDYYLKHDFYKTWTSQGWVFMDYRNNPIELNDNTIIYGHKLKSGLMFGTLDTTLKKSWYQEKDNQIITFNTPSTNMKWQIFSIYRTEYTTDYLVTNFYNVDNYNSFVNVLKNRSIYDFGVELEYGDKILSLSTCIGLSASNQRLVIHAKLIQ